MESGQALTFEESRVLGCLLEKEMSTPDYYPMTPAALLAACNQLSNREPVVSLDQRTVDGAAMNLRRKGMAAMVQMAGSRVGKLRHLLEDCFPSLGRPERALLAVLLLRGPQTVAELRARTERMHEFGGAGEVEASLARLLENEDRPLAVHLPPGGGRRVSTYAHLLGGEVVVADGKPGLCPEVVVSPPPDLLAELAMRLSDLDSKLAGLEGRLAWLEESLGSKAPDPVLRTEDPQDTRR